jgi:hypothetical protein
MKAAGTPELVYSRKRSEKSYIQPPFKITNILLAFRILSIQAGLKYNVDGMQNTQYKSMILWGSQSLVSQPRGRTWTED